MNNPKPEKLINELLHIEAFAEQLRQRCYKARKSLESFYSPASEGKRRKIDKSQTLKILAKRRSTINRSIG